MRSSPTGYTSPHTASPRRAGAEIRDAVRCGPGRRSEGCRAPVESAERGYYPEGGRGRGGPCGGAVPDHAGGSGAESGCRASGPDSETPRERARRVAVRRPRDTFDRYACDTSGHEGSRLLFSIDVYTRDALHHRAPESFSAVSSRRPSERPQLFMRCVYIRRGSSRARVRHISATASRRACSGAFTNRRRQCASPTTPAMTNFSPHDPMTPPVTPSTHSPILRALMTCLAFDVAHVVARSMLSTARSQEDD